METRISTSAMDHVSSLPKASGAKMRVLRKRIYERECII